MADNVTIDNGDLTDYAASTDEAASGHVQRVKLTYSADGSDTHIPADANGLKVNLSNNDVTVTSGTVTVGGTATVTAVGTASVAVTSLSSLAAGTAYAGSFLIGDATDRATMLGLSNGTAVLTAIGDSNGDQVAFPAITRLTASPTIYSAGTATQYDSLHTAPMEFTSAASANDGSGQIIGGVLISKHDSFSGKIRLELFSNDLTDSTGGSALSVSDTDVLTSLGSLLFDFSESNMGTARSALATGPKLPLVYKCTGTQSSLWGFLQLWSNDTPTFAASDLVPYLFVLPD